VTDETDIADEDPGLAEALTEQRPVPPPGFRGALGRYLANADPGYGPRPARLRLMVAGLVSGGVLIMGLGLLQATGSF
jgi:hypothetical protein